MLTPPSKNMSWNTFLCNWNPSLAFLLYALVQIIFCTWYDPSKSYNCDVMKYSLISQAIYMLPRCKF